MPIEIRAGAADVHTVTYTIRVRGDHWTVDVCQHEQDE